MPTPSQPEPSKAQEQEAAGEEMRTWTPEKWAKMMKQLEELAASQGTTAEELLDRIGNAGHGGPNPPPDWKPSTQNPPLSAEEQAELTARSEASIDRAMAEASAAFKTIHFRFATEEEVARNPDGLVWRQRLGPRET